MDAELAVNRNNAQYKRIRKDFLALHEQHGGWWRCWGCSRLTQNPQIDHIEHTGMGGSAERLLDTTNWQILCGASDNNCHGKKDSGLTHH